MHEVPNSVQQRQLCQKHSKRVDVCGRVASVAVPVAFNCLESAGRCRLRLTCAFWRRLLSQWQSQQRRHVLRVHGADGRSMHVVARIACLAPDIVS